MTGLCTAFPGLPAVDGIDRQFPRGFGFGFMDIRIRSKIADLDTRLAALGELRGQLEQLLGECFGGWHTDWTRPALDPRHGGASGHGPGVTAVAPRLERALLPLVLAVTVLGLSLPGPARAAVAANGITIALVVLVAAVGLGLPRSAITDARMHAGRVLLAVAIPLFALPALAWTAGRLLPPGPLRDGILAVGVAPAEVASVALAALAGASATLAAAVLIASTLGTVLLAGPTLHLLAPGSSHFSTLSLLVSLLAIIALPLIAGIVVRAALPAGHHRQAEQVSSQAASLAVLVLIWLVAGQAHLGQAYLRAALALLLFLAASVLLAAALTRRLAGSVSTALFLPVAMRDFAIAAGIATRAFGAPAAAALGLYGVLVLALGTATARLAHTRR